MPNFTQNAIMASLLKLLNQRPLDKITVKDIVDDCGVNRNTFYYHFEDIRALVVYLFRTETEHILEEYPDTEPWQEGILRASRLAMENRRAVYHIYNSMRREELEQYLYQVISRVMTVFVGQRAEGIDADPQDKQLIIDFYQYAVVGLMLHWLGNNMQGDVDGLLRRLGFLFEGNIVQSLERSAAHKSDKLHDLSEKQTD